MQVSLQYAQEHLEDLASALDRGEEIEIARPEKATLKLIVSNTAIPATRTGKRILGAGRGEMVVPSAEQWQAMDEELARLINESPLFPTKAE